MEGNLWACWNVHVGLIKEQCLFFSFERGLKLSLQNVTKALYQEFLCPVIKFFSINGEVFNIQKWANDASDDICNVFFLFYV